MMLPQFIAIGPQRTATTWLYERLKGVAVFPHGVKETLFFDRHFEKGLDWYLAHFRTAAGSQIIGEVGPSYFHSSLARKRISETIPKCKIVCTLRDPVKRIYSLYRLMREYGWTALPFSEAIEKHPEMLDSSRYSYHLHEWISLFGKDQVLVVFNEDLYRDAQSYLDNICRFTGLKTVKLASGQEKTTEKEMVARSTWLAAFGQSTGDWLRSHRCYGIVNLAKKLGLKKLFFSSSFELPPLDVEMEQELRKRFLPDIIALEKLLGVDLQHWK